MCNICICSGTKGKLDAVFANYIKTIVSKEIPTVMKLFTRKDTYDCSHATINFLLITY